MLNMPELNLSDINPRRRPLRGHPPITEEQCEQLACACYKRGWSDAMRHERERQRDREQGVPPLLQVLAAGVFFVLFLCWLAKGN